MSWDICLRDEDNPKITWSSVIVSQICLFLKFGPVFFLPSLLFKLLLHFLISSSLSKVWNPKRKGKETSDWFLLRPCPHTHSLSGLPQVIILHCNELFSKNTVYLRVKVPFSLKLWQIFLLFLYLLWPCCSDSRIQNRGAALSHRCSGSWVPEVSFFVCQCQTPFSSASSPAPVGRQGQGTLHSATL